MKKLILVFLGVLLIFSLNTFGDKVIFTSGDNPNWWYIYSMNVYGSDLQQLTTEDSYYPSISPDKTKIAYSQKVTLPTEHFEIYVMNLDGSDKKRLTFNETGHGNLQPTWGPNSEWIYYKMTTAPSISEIRKVHYTGISDVFIVHVQKDDTPQVSPDNQYLYFRTDPNVASNDTIRRVDIDGSNLTTILASDGTADYYPQLNNSGTEILLDTSEVGVDEPINLYILDISSGAKFPLFSRSGGESYRYGRYSVDGTKIVYSYTSNFTELNDYDLWMCDPDGSNQQQLTSNSNWDCHGVLIENNSPFLDWTGEVNYSFDGLDPEAGNNATNFIFRINYFDVDNDAPLAGHPQVHISDGGSEITGSPFPMMDVDPGDTTYTDGKLYTYSTTLPAGSSYMYIFEAKDEHYFANYDSTSFPIAGPNVTAPVTGYRVIFFSGDETISSWNIFSMNIDGSDLQQLTTNNSSTSQSISPDKTKIAYTSVDEIWLMNLDGSDKNQLTNTTVGKAWEPCWSPDGEWIYYANIENPAAGQSSIRKIRKDGTGDIFINQIYDDIGPMVSPDNLYVYFRSEPGTQSNDTIRRMDIDGSNVITILASDGNADYRPGLSPDGTEIIVATAAFGDSEPQNLYIIDISSGSKSPIFTRAGNETYRQGTFFDSGNKIIFNYSSDHAVNNSHDLWISDKDGSNKQQITNNSNSDRKAIIIENNSVPTLTYTGEVNYVGDGLDPETGHVEDLFTWCVNYTSSSNIMPKSGYPKVHILKAGQEITGSPFAMTEVDTNDSDSTDGKYYVYSSTLATGKDYTYYFEAYNAFNTVAEGEATAPKDAPDVGEKLPPATVTDLHVRGQSYNVIVLEWTIPGDDGWIGTAEIYDFRYSFSPINDDGDFSTATQCDSEPPPHWADGERTQKFTVTELQKETTYYFAMKTKDDENNWSALSNCANGYTGVLHPKEASTHSWETGDGGDTYHITNWEVQILQQNDSLLNCENVTFSIVLANTWVQVIDPNLEFPDTAAGGENWSNDYVIFDLTNRPGDAGNPVTYIQVWFDVIYHDAATRSVLTIPGGSLQIPIPGPVSPPKDVAAEQVNEKVRLSWKPSKVGGDPDGYNIYRKVNDGKWEQINPLPVTERIFKDNDVEDSFRYSYKVTSILGDYESGYSAVAKVKVKLNYETLDEVQNYPNPAKDKVVFNKLPRGAKVMIFTLSGELVYTLNADSSKEEWYLINKAGKKVGNGIYYYVIKYNGKTKKGKIAIVR